ncbi:ArsR family transcriptional regulator [Curtobacterium sp. MCSS17_016]|uniref:ArsR family transcriptional regulator n=1 Tax=Curtobacterium sp. MCSS17_016 TaxID=2175644 RepID=UPI000DAA8761|nr:ArsR family transcriptional regulator [Curtobacterium sp. MCSS17_016]WIE80979.1 hypothetical protein DEJ19_020900 [Curtobacterium sp. MCSS17_016]
MLNPGTQYSISELARTVDVPYATAHREVSRLLEAELFTAEPAGRTILVRANPDAIAYKPTVELLQLSFGPPVVLGRLLGRVAGVEEAYIYGSWAARRLGEGGSPPGDIDALVVGRPDRGELYEAAMMAERELRREVSARAVSRELWESASDPFLKTVRQRPLVRLDLQGEPRDREQVEQRSS